MAVSKQPIFHKRNGKQSRALDYQFAGPVLAAANSDVDINEVLIHYYETRIQNNDSVFT